MYVPNYIPEPLEVPGNITQQPYRMRIRFIRLVVWLHSAGIVLVAGLTFAPGRNVSTRWIGLVLVSVLILLDLLRIRLRGTALEARLSGAFLPAVWLLAAWSAADLARHGWPSWAILFGAGAVLLYTVVCGRDFSFVGCFLLSWIASTLGIVAVATSVHISAETTGRALLMDLVYLAYTVYDLASLLARRRENEALAAVVDLYRDVFNFIGYFSRCVHHWRKHKIWALPK